MVTLCKGLDSQTLAAEESGAIVRQKTWDPRNLIQDCLRRGVKSPLSITRDELRTEFCVCQKNIELLTKNGPLFWLKHLQDLLK